MALNRRPELIGTPEGSRGALRKGLDGDLKPVRGMGDHRPEIPRSLPEKYTEGGLCAGYRANIYDAEQDSDINHWEAGRGMRPEGIKRRRLRCPRCGRRIMSSVRVCHDGCCVYHNIPPHKPKEWWK